MITRLAKSKARQFIESRGFVLYRRPWLPRGIDFLQDIEWQPKPYHPAVVCDVGANVGDFSLRIVKSFPGAAVHAFEPAPKPLAEFASAARNYPAIHVHQMALGAKAGTAEMVFRSKSTLSSLLPELNTELGPGDERRQVRIGTLDGFAQEHRLGTIDLLKIDTEGFDLDVLRGAESLLRSGKIGWIICEAGLTSALPRFVPLAELQAHLAPRGFVLFGLYDQRSWNDSQSIDFVDTVWMRRDGWPKES